MSVNQNITKIIGFQEIKKKMKADKLPFELDLGKNNLPSSSIDNFLAILENDPHFVGMRFNLLTNSPEQQIEGITVRWTDDHDSATRHYIEKNYGLHNIQKCYDAMRIVFSRNQYHPVRDLVESFRWDGVERISEFLVKWTKCEDNEYTREVSRLIFAGGIHRLYNPGCKFDDMPVLVGTRQGEGKSTLVRWIALKDEYFSEISEFDGQRGIESLEGAWICEVSELLALTKTKEQEAVKSFLTRLNDRYRMPFDRRVTDHPRQCIFIGTTNKAEFLTDKSGNRRFYPIKVNQSGYDLFNQELEVKEYIKQCWAEAYVKFQKNQLPPYADRKLLRVIRENQMSATEDDYRIGMIHTYLEDKFEICILDLWFDALKMSEFLKPSRRESNEIALIMQGFDGWEKQKHPKRFVKYGVQRWWKKNKTTDEKDNDGVINDINDNLENDTLGILQDELPL